MYSKLARIEWVSYPSHFNKTPNDRHLCKYCKTEVENEIHFILKYPQYDTLRGGTFFYIFESVTADLKLFREFCLIQITILLINQFENL